MQGYWDATGLCSTASPHQAAPLEVPPMGQKWGLPKHCSVWQSLGTDGDGCALIRTGAVGGCPVGCFPTPGAGVGFHCGCSSAGGAQHRSFGAGTVSSHALLSGLLHADPGPVAGGLQDKRPTWVCEEGGGFSGHWKAPGAHPALPVPQLSCSISCPLHPHSRAAQWDGGRALSSLLCCSRCSCAQC